MSCFEHVHPNSVWRLQADIFVPGEDPDAFDALHVSIRDTWLPISEIEKDLVYEMAVTRWRMRRTTLMEKSLVAVEIERARKDPENAGMDQALFEAKIWLAVSTSPAMKQIHRTENRLRRAYEKATKELEDFQNRRYENERTMRKMQARHADETKAEAKSAGAEALHECSNPVASPAQPAAVPRLPLPTPLLQNEPKPSAAKQPKSTDPMKAQRAA